VVASGGCSLLCEGKDEQPAGSAMARTMTAMLVIPTMVPPVASLKEGATGYRKSKAEQRKIFTWAKGVEEMHVKVPFRHKICPLPPPQNVLYIANKKWYMPPL
jgi:hypothetical protein